jgi:hypothetical protein
VKIILSRKGFDSATGRVPSPILPSGELIFLPIPEPCPRPYSFSYGDLTIAGHELGPLVEDLTGGAISRTSPAHLDPDLYPGSLARPAGWKPLFGQAGSAERHLQNRGVAEGDLFLFFGWFRQVEVVGGRYRYVKGSPDRHIIFGWLQVERRVPSNIASGIAPWVSYHPHAGRDYGEPDSIYLSTDSLRLQGLSIDRLGGGAFGRYDDSLALTAPGASRSVWRLPPWFFPDGGRDALSYHAGPGRWTRQDDCTLLRTVGRGQEFVLDCEHYPEAIDWLSEILRI